MKHQNESITYTERVGIFYPDFTIPKYTDYPIGKYGRIRLDFLKKHRRGTYTSLLVAFKLNAHLAEVDHEAHVQVEMLTAELARQRDIDERLKATDQLRWVQKMNNAKQNAEEIVLNEIIYN